MMSNCTTRNTHFQLHASGSLVVRPVPIIENALLYVWMYVCRVLYLRYVYTPDVCDVIIPSRLKDYVYIWSSI